MVHLFDDGDSVLRLLGKPDKTHHQSAVRPEARPRHIPLGEEYSYRYTENAKYKCDQVKTNWSQ
jgi:hypothetical protein